MLQNRNTADMVERLYNWFSRSNCTYGSMKNTEQSAEKIKQTVTVAKGFMPLKLFNNLSRCNHKLKCFLLGLYITNQCKVVHNCKMKGNW